MESMVELLWLKKWGGGSYASDRLLYLPVVGDPVLNPSSVVPLSETYQYEISFDSS